MRLIKQEQGCYTRFTIVAVLDDGRTASASVLESTRWIGKHRSGTHECRLHLAEELRFLRRRLRRCEYGSRA
jgi:hypothetical protein